MRELQPQQLEGTLLPRRRRNRLEWCDSAIEECDAGDSLAMREPLADARHAESIIRAELEIALRRPKGRA